MAKGTETHPAIHATATELQLQAKPTAQVQRIDKMQAACKEAAQVLRHPTTEWRGKVGAAGFSRGSECVAEP